MTTETTTDSTPEYCRCCHGSGVQINLVTGITNKCPCCGGSGRVRVPEYVIATI